MLSGLNLVTACVAYHGEISQGRVSKHQGDGNRPIHGNPNTSKRMCVYISNTSCYCFLFNESTLLELLENYYVNIIFDRPGK